MTPALDEMVDGAGGVRPHWRGILGALSSFGPQALNERARRLGQAINEDGPSPEWRCDPVPLPLAASEFETLTHGLAQRADLLEALLADLYGPQQLLADGLVPPALVHANPFYLRACRARLGGRPPPRRYLLTYTADLARGPDGRWRVLADRTGGAIGIGYAREARRLLARVLPELFRTAQVRQLRPFFEAWQDSLLRMGAQAHQRAGAPVLAMLTPGSSDPHWPECLSLSRDLACALVETRDLTVRGGKLSIKTLRGLQPVDVLIRRLPGVAIDPLEAESWGPGVAGLLDAMRSGAVRMLNHPGAAAIEAPGVAALLPALSERLLAQPLRLETAIAPAACSLAPTLGADGLAPQPVILRLFLMHGGDGWHAMQGGLARVATPGQPLTEALPVGVTLKDVWVLSQETGPIQGPNAWPQPRIAVIRGAGDMPSRVADDFYWLGRYVERLDQQARVGRAGLLRRARGAPLPREIAELAVLGRCLRAVGFDPGETGAPFEARWRLAMPAAGPVGAGLDQAGRLIEALRDRMTVETHGAFTHALQAARTDVTSAMRAGPDGLVYAMDGLQRLATTVAGISAEGMVRGGGRLFLDLGRRMERAMAGGYLLGAVLKQPPSRIDGTLRLALELADSAITYRSRYLSALQPAPALDLVLADPDNPRALAFQFEAAASLLEDAGDADLAHAALRQQQALQAVVDAVTAASDPADEAAAQADALVGIGNAAADLSNRVTRRFFALLPKLQSVGLEMA